MFHKQWVHDTWFENMTGKWLNPTVLFLLINLHPIVCLPFTFGVIPQVKGKSTGFTIHSWLMVWNIFYFSHILGILTPTDFHIFQRGRYTTNQIVYGTKNPGVPLVSSWFFLKPIPVWGGKHLQAVRVSPLELETQRWKEGASTVDVPSKSRFSYGQHRLLVIEPDFTQHKRELAWYNLKKTW